MPGFPINMMDAVPRDGLLYRFHAKDAIHQDRIKSGIGTLMTSGSWSSGLVSSSTTDGGAYFTPDSRVWSIGTDCSIVVRATVTTLVSSSKLLCIPYANGTWVSPFAALTLCRSSTNARLSLQMGVSGTQFTCSSADGGLQAGETVTYGVTRTGTTVVFYRDGAALGANNTNLTTSSAPTFTNQQPVVLLNRSNSSAGEGIQGTLFFAAIWNRVLSASEMVAVHQAVL